jgi:hypothetical protein
MTAQILGAAAAPACEQLPPAAAQLPPAAAQLAAGLVAVQSLSATAELQPLPLQCVLHALTWPALPGLPATAVATPGPCHSHSAAVPAAAPLSHTPGGHTQTITVHRQA